MKPITVGNDTYTSISAAWRAVSPPGLSLVTVRWRLRAGWNPYLAFKFPVVVPTNRRTFPDYRNQIDDLML